MEDKKHQETEFDLGFDPAPAPEMGKSLRVATRDSAELSPAQAEFNKLMKRLENTRRKQQQEERRLDQMLATCVRELIPMVEELSRINLWLLLHGVDTLKSLKLTARRKDALSDLLRGKAEELLMDPIGLSEDEVNRIRNVMESLTTPQSEESRKNAEAQSFQVLRGMMEDLARGAGVDLDLSDVDPHCDPAELERMLNERLDAAVRETAGSFSPCGRSRKPTKAQLEKERKRQEAEEAKRRDLKSLYKQLAKVLHPDLEADPAQKLRKEEWMKRLTTAHASGDLRELLCIEMEWLGVEASNLATASDEKLKVYCAVLKEQIAEVKTQTESLIYQPQYAAMERFRTGFGGVIPLPAYIREDLVHEIGRHQQMLDVLEKGGAGCQAMMNDWADHHARAMKRVRLPF